MAGENHMTSNAFIKISPKAQQRPAQAAHLPVLHFSWSSAWLHAMTASNRQHHLGADTHRVWLDP
jgi:hypothetical protein